MSFIYYLYNDIININNLLIQCFIFFIKQMDTQAQYQICKCTQCLDINSNGILVHKKIKIVYKKKMPPNQY